MRSFFILSFCCGFFISCFSQVSYDVTITDSDCAGSCTGIISLNITTGSPPFVFTMNNDTLSPPFSGLCTGVYSIAVFDSNQDSAFSTEFISSPQPLTVFGTSTNLPSCSDDCTGSFEIEYFGGTGAPISSLHINGNAASSLVVSNVCSGHYLIEIEEINGCVVPYDYFLPSSDNFCQGVVNTSNSNPLQNSKVLLIKYNQANQSLKAVDSMTTTSSGSFAFNHALGAHYIKAIPNISLYPNERPTYYLNSPSFQFANEVSCTDPLNFSTLSGINSGGPGFVGGFIGDGAGKFNEFGNPIPNLIVILSNSLNEIEISRTDTNGYFYFENIPCDNYSIFVDDGRVNGLNVPIVSLNTADCQSDSLTFLLNTANNELILSTQNRVNISDYGLKVFPNPTNSFLNISSNNNADISNFEVMDSNGAIILSLPFEQKFLDVDISDLVPGIYFLRFKTSSNIIEGYQKFIVY